jgi:hypothetical protein
MTINEELLKLAVKRIEADPQSWNQGEWVLQGACGTTFCLAGHVLMADGGYDVLTDEDGPYFPIPDPGAVAGGLLGLDPSQILALFHSYDDDWSVETFKEYITRVTGVRFDG